MFVRNLHKHYLTLISHINPTLILPETLTLILVTICQFKLILYDTVRVLYMHG